MPSFQGWIDLPPELFCRVADGLDDLRFYTSVRGTCTAWRGVLPPPSPSLLVLLRDNATRRRHAAIVSLPAHLSFGLKAIPSGSSCLGCGGGWLALSVCLYDGQSLTLFHPVTAAEILLPPLIYDTRLLSKIVFAPDPARDDFVAATICNIDRLAYVTAGARRWAIPDRVRLATGDQLVDVVYHQNGQNGMVYCLTRFGNVYVLRLPERRRREPVIIEDQTSAEDLVTHNRRIIQMHNAGSDLNAPASVQPLLFSSVSSFTPLYVVVSDFTSAKNLVFCNGNLYRSGGMLVVPSLCIWREAVIAV
uniref:KIB1-4 beta-propeller domain-containing protein n=1 Tax=Triticum urartu TaxID=4572 RepID=A0A8R7U3I1_TRIUA